MSTAPGSGRKVWLMGALHPFTCVSASCFLPPTGSPKTPPLPCSWEEFEGYLSEDLAAGKTLLSGEYVLPSGTALPFGAMLTKLRRERLLQDIFEVRFPRQRPAVVEGIGADQAEARAAAAGQSCGVCPGSLGH